VEAGNLEVLRVGLAAERLLMRGHPPRIDVIVVAHGPKPLLDDCMTAILSSAAISPRILLIDNGCAHPVMRTAGTQPDVEPDCLRLLAAALEDEHVGIVMPMILRRSDGRVNSAGNPLHVLGFSWAGQNGTLAGPTTSQGITVASGATLMLSRRTWRRLGGFAREFFLYHEDVDLSIACHQADLRVILEPAATVHHDYSWDRNAVKFELAERTRLLVLLTRYPRALLLRLLPILLVTEIGALLIGGLPGARRAKLRGYVWLAHNTAWILARRRENLHRAITADGFVAHLTPRFDEGAPETGRGPALLDAVLPTYLRLVGFPLTLATDRTTR